MNILTKNDTITVDGTEKKVSEITLKDLENLYYRDKIITLFKFITDDNYYIKMQKEA